MPLVSCLLPALFSCLSSSAEPGPGLGIWILGISSSEETRIPSRHRTRDWNVDFRDPAMETRDTYALESLTPAMENLRDWNLEFRSLGHSRDAITGRAARLRLHCLSALAFTDARAWRCPADLMRDKLIARPHNRRYVPYPSMSACDALTLSACAPDAGLATQRDVGIDLAVPHLRADQTARAWCA